MPPWPDLTRCSSWTAGPTTNVTTADGNSSLFPAVAALDDGFGVAWQDERSPHGVYYARLDAAGARTGADVPLATASGLASTPQLAWNGSQLGVVWEDFEAGGFVVDAARFDGDGAPIGAPVKLSTPGVISRRPAITADGDWVAAWVVTDDTDDEDIWIGRLLAEGTAGAPIQITDAAGSQYAPSIATSTSGVVRTAWHDMRAGEADIYSASTADVSIATPVTINEFDSLVPSIAPSGDGWAIAYHDIRSGFWQTYLAHTDVAGAAYYETPLSSGGNFYANFPRVVEATSVSVVVWQETEGGDIARIVAARVRSSGGIIGDPVIVANTRGVGAPAIAAAANGDIGIAWQEAAVGAEIRFARIVCAE